MRLYAIINAVHRSYPIAVFWCYVGAFALAMAMMFVFPPGTIVLLFLALASLAVVVVIHFVLGFLLSSVARVILNRGACPACGHRFECLSDGASGWTCDACSHVFARSGAELSVLIADTDS